MKRLSSILLITALAAAQVARWETNNTWTGTNDFSGGKAKPPLKTISTLPSAASNTNINYVVTDGSTSSDCTIGSGSTRVSCISNGAAWVALGGGGGGGGSNGYTTVTFSTTPTFTAASATGTSFLLTLTGNVSSSTLASAATGQIITFKICQDGTGSRTFVPPANVLNMATLEPTASACLNQTFVYDGTNAQALGVGFTTGVSASSYTKYYGITSGTAILGVADIAGTPAKLLLPITTGTAGQTLITDGGTPQQTSWSTPGGSVTSTNGATARIAVFDTASNINGQYGSTNAFTWNGYGLSVQGAIGGPVNTNGVTIDCSSTTSFNENTIQFVRIRLTGNCTASASGTPNLGYSQVLIVEVCQDGTGSRTFTWPASFISGMTVGATASKCSVQSFMSDGTNSKWYAMGVGVLNQ